MTLPERRTRRGERGFTLIEVVIATTLVALLSICLLIAFRAGLTAMERSNDRLMYNRRVTSVERIVEQQFGGMMPVAVPCLGADPSGGAGRIPFFQGERQSVRFVSSYSLAEGQRGLPRILEFQVEPGDRGEGVRLIVNERSYTGPAAAGLLCTGKAPDLFGRPGPIFQPIALSGASFVLADRLSVCRFAFREASYTEAPPRWVERWVLPLLPDAVRVEMAPLAPDASRLQLAPLTIPLHITRDPLATYIP